MHRDRNSHMIKICLIKCGIIDQHKNPRTVTKKKSKLEENWVIESNGQFADSDRKP